MKNRLPNVIPPVLIGSSAIFLAVFVGCSTSVPARVRPATEYLPETEVTHHREVVQTTRDDEGTEPARASASHHPSKSAEHTETAAASPGPRGKRPKKVESEIGKTSDLQIDEETRQRMNAGGGADTPKGKKVESEIRDASDLQIDEQTKQKMDGSR